MSYRPISYYPPLSWYDMDTALHLPLSMYTPGAGSAGYDNAARFTASYAGADLDPVFSFTGVAGAIYSVSSSSYVDPRDLLVYDGNGVPFAQDDLSGFYGSDHLTFVAPYSGTYFVDASWVQGNLSGQRAVSLSILEDVDSVSLPVVAGTERSEQLDGSKNHDALYGYDGDDSLFGGGGDDFLDGGGGIDSAFYNGNRANFTVVADGDRFRVGDRQGTEGRDWLSNVERLDFKDVAVALDIDGEGGQAYRLYQAAFDRTPDKVGLGYWIAQLDSGTSLEAVARSFVASPEFAALYGVRPTNAQMITQFYENVLHRAPDQAGVNYWVDILDRGQDTVANVLADFSESQENYAQLIGVMKNGVEYQMWG